MVKSALSITLALLLGSSIVPCVYAIEYDESHEQVTNDLEHERAQALERARNRAREQIAKQAEQAAKAQAQQAQQAQKGSPKGSTEAESYAIVISSLKEKFSNKSDLQDYEGQALSNSSVEAAADVAKNHSTKNSQTATALAKSAIDFENEPSEIEDETFATLEGDAKEAIVEVVQESGDMAKNELIEANNKVHEWRNDAASARAAAVQSKDKDKEFVDPLAKEAQPSLLKRIFGIGLNLAEANPVDDISAANSQYLNLKVFGDVETLMSTADGSDTLLKTIPYKITDDMLIPYQIKQQETAEELHKGISFVAYLFHMYTPQASTYKIPTFFIDAAKLNQARTSVAFGQDADYQKLVSTKGSSKSYPLYHLNMVRDLVYTDGPCKGLSYIEADLKGKCKVDQQYNGILLLSMPLPEIEDEGIYTGVPLQITPNVLQSNFFAQGMEVGARYIGFHTSFDEVKQKFTAPLHSLDKHIYSPTLGRFIDENTSYKDIDPNCTQFDSSQKCQLYFVGIEVNKLLKPGNQDSEFNLNVVGSLDLGTPDVNIAPQALAYEAVAKDELLRAQEVANASQLAQEQADKIAKHKEAVDKDHKGIAIGDLMNRGAEQKASETQDRDAQELAGKSLESSMSEQSTNESAQEQLANNEASINANEKKDEGYGIDKQDSLEALYGIPISFTRLGKPSLNLRNTILSSDQYKNYTLLTELEMALLSDLGYRLEPREFFGNSIYSFGSEDNRITRHARRPYAFYDHRVGTYNVKRPSRMPLGIGVHIYGSYNDVIHDAMVNSIGEGSLGVRIDGTKNYYYQTSNSSIVTKGDNSTGIGFTYGRNNSAYISGYVGALGKGGIGIKVDMGSNIYSDLIEYRGSYIRVRTLDYLQGSTSVEEASRVPLLDDLNGPQVEDLIIDGVVEGSQAAILIDESSFVKNIIMTTDAVVNGGIYSAWSPSANGKGQIMLYHDGKNTDLIDAQIQLPEDESLKDLTTRQIIDRKLTTNINLGVLLDENNKPIMHDAEKNIYIGNEKSRVVLSGDISGSTFNLRHFAGNSTILGDVRANRVVVYNGILSLSGNAGSINQIRNLILRSKSVLDYVNGESSHTYVDGNIRLGRNVTIRIDADPDGMPLDDISYSGKFSVANYQLTIEPGVNYIDMRRLGADPKAFMNFMANFVDQCNKRFAQDGIVLRFPHYLWDNTGGYGREIKCTAQGCHLGNFVSSENSSNVTDVEPWRYYLSFGGLILLILCSYGWYYLHWFNFSCFKAKDNK